MWTGLAAWIGSFVLGIGVVWKFLNKWSPKMKNALAITDETLDIARSILDAWEDRKITKEEIEGIVREIEELQKVLGGDISG